MRRLNLIPEDVLARRRRGRLLRRNGALLSLWFLVLTLALLGARNWNRREVGALRQMEASVRSLEVEAERLEPLRAERARLEERTLRLAHLESRRPVTGLLALVAASLPARLQLESVTIAPATGTAAVARPGQAAYFGTPSATTLRLEMRGTGGGPDEVAALMRTLERCGRFRRVQLTRLDRPAQAGGKLRFEMRCEL